VPPKPKTVVLPEKPKPVPKPKPKPEVKAKPKPKPEPKPAKPEPKAAPEPPQQSYSDVLAELRAEEASVSPAPAAGAGAAASARGPGVLVSPEVMAWMRRAKVHVTRAWVLAPGFRDQALQTEVTVRLGADGKVLTTRITRRSGNPWFDESVERALAKASPLPAPPEAREWSFLFTPQDVF
jgi:TonB family protein